jgi:hypothetical protein
MRRAILFLITCVCVGVACKNGSSDAAPARAPQSAAPPTATSLPSAPAARAAPSASGAPQSWKWTFETEAVDKPPPGFLFARTGGGSVGRWVVRAEGGSNVVAQLDADATSFRFPLAIAEQPALRDVRVAVRCKAISGKVDQACGLVGRYRDENNYVVTRANALEGNVRLYTVKGGKREQMADHASPITANAWHELRLELRGERLQVFWDGAQVIDQRDAAFLDAGRVGLWTKADSVTHFDDLSVEAL